MVKSAREQKHTHERAAEGSVRVNQPIVIEQKRGGESVGSRHASSQTICVILMVSDAVVVGKSLQVAKCVVYLADLLQSRQRAARTSVTKAVPDDEELVSLSKRLVEDAVLRAVQQYMEETQQNGAAPKDEGPPVSKLNSTK
ncbi:A-kinase anchor protein 7 isoforms alpha and beta [Anabarilius grahami]|uniref:A-kinase anchor protein 7 isoforms alpha and beta n=1 Tax=Anabarilius grahami TaxID=495550 RepID=A0A3N0YD40_ANAGA|nr:A-kinase anchor protein 7 isoforms alpha and beta [Anabarilius grahami]